MRIVDIIPHRVRIPFRSEFSHALCSRCETETIILEVRSDTGAVGVGEILPRPYLTGETLDRVMAEALPELARRWNTMELHGRNEVFAALSLELSRSGRSLATCAGWELALLDLAGKVFGFSAGDVVGPGAQHDLEPAAVIDFNIPTGKLECHCRMLRLRGLHHIKVKVGLADDVRRVEIVRKALGPSRPLRLDANAAWTADAAVDNLRQLKRFDIASIEQPVAAHDLAGMRTVREKTGVPVSADESLCSFSDGEHLIQGKAADIFNIRIAKCGGLIGSAQLVVLAREAGLSCYLGTLVGETGILSRAAEVLGAHIREFEFLEGKGQNRTLLAEDIVLMRSRPSEPAYGLGVELLQDRLDKYRISGQQTRDLAA